MAEKGPNYETNLLLLLFPYKCIKRARHFINFEWQWFKTLGPIFDETRDKKIILTKGPNFFLSTAKFFGQSGWIILKGVCNTNLTAILE
jgi:hypothetical protein